MTTMKFGMSFVSVFLLLATLLAADTPSPALLVVNIKDSTLAIVDPVTRTVVARVRTGSLPHEVIASPDGKLAFVSNYGNADKPGNSISIIDLASQKELRRVDLGPMRSPHGLAFAGGKLYFTCENNRSVGRYDPATDKVDWLLGLGQSIPHWIHVNAGLDQIYISNVGSRTISVLTRCPDRPVHCGEGDGGPDWSQALVPVARGVSGFAIAPGGKELWLAPREGGLSVVDLSTRSVTRTHNVRTKLTKNLIFTPDGELVLVTDQEGGNLLVLEQASAKEIGRIPVGKPLGELVVEPSGAFVYLSSQADNSVAVIDLKSLKVVARISTGNEPDGVAWAVP